MFYKMDFCFHFYKMFYDIFLILDFPHNYEWQLKFEVKKLFSFVFQMVLNMSEHGDLLI